ncbi:MAG: beta-ketoacyl synthase N-terminal-like domain-containing protein [Verrucomicrobiota bacterium]
MNNFQPIAITGMSATFPRASVLDEFWRVILSGKDCMTEIPPSYWLLEDFYDPDPNTPLKTYSRHGGFIPKVAFDPAVYGVPPTLAASTDVVQLLALILARRALEDTSNHQIDRLNLERTSVILGMSAATDLLITISGQLARPTWVEGMRQAGITEEKVNEATERISALLPDWNEAVFPGMLGGITAGRIANRFNLGGTNCTVDAACASSFGAIHLGISELLLGRSDRIITGAVDALNNVWGFMSFSKTPTISPTGKCRPFSENADGLTLGEGGGIIILRLLEDAERDGDPIYAVIHGLGTSSDGRSRSIYAPRSTGQQTALERCYEQAGYEPRSVSLLEAHGTATAAGDRCEIAALKSVFAKNASTDLNWCALGSIKSQIGHTKCAAGTASLIKTVCALQNRVLPPTANVSKPHPRLDLENSPFYLNTRAKPWISSRNTPRRASVSSFGFGGTNFHATLEEYRGKHKAPRIRSISADVFLCSAHSAYELKTAVAKWAGVRDVAAFENLAHSSQLNFCSDHTWRLATIAENYEQLTTKAAQILAWIEDPSAKDVANTWICRGQPPADRSTVAFVFPGECGQRIEPMAEIPMHFTSAMDAWEIMDSAAEEVDLKLSEVLYPPQVFTDEQRALQNSVLHRSENEQVAINAISAGCLAVLRSAGLQPAMSAGFNCGELLAVHVAGAVSLEEVIRISRKRGEIAGYLHANKPKHTGSESSSIDAGSLVEWTTYLKEVPAAAFEIPIYSSTTRDLLPRDLHTALTTSSQKPTEFIPVLQRMRDQGARVFVEVGPGHLLTQFAQNELGSESLCIALLKDGQPSDQSMLGALAALAVAGLPVKWSFLWDGFRSPRSIEKLSAATFEIDGRNIGRRYPLPGGSSAKTPPVLSPVQPPENEKQTAQKSVPLSLQVPPRTELPEFQKSLIESMPQPEKISLSPAINPDAAVIGRTHETFLRVLGDTHRAYLNAIQR